MTKTTKEELEEEIMPEVGKMKESDNYATPNWIKELFEDYFDPCPYNPSPTVDGLLMLWPEKTFVNPPYSNPLPWVIKAIEENKRGKHIALLLKLDCSTKWYRLLHEADAHFMFINERVKFNGKAPPFCNCLVILESYQKGGRVFINRIFNGYTRRNIKQ